MIFLTLGTQLPFDRLIKATDNWAAKNKDVKIFGQIANSRPNNQPPQHFPWQDFLAPNEFQLKFDQADFILSHAGMGSIISALNASKPIIIFPRSAKLSEHRNDHQSATASHFANKKGIYLARDENELHFLLDKIMTQELKLEAGSADEFANVELVTAIKSFIETD